ncbi:MAG: methionyl-tRNA formyltransferase [Acidimicrobiales bacterium]
MTLAVPPPQVRRVAYLGTPEIAVPPLVALHEAGFEIALVITGADKRRGRGGQATPTPVKQAALERGLPVSHDLDQLLDVEVDLGVVVAYGRIIPRSVLEQVPLVNIHFSLLPRWRGAAPVERALLAGDTETGVCLMVVDEELDTGGVYGRAVTPITGDDTLATLRERLVDQGSQLLVSALSTGLGPPIPQEGDPSYAHKIDPTELEIDWSDTTAAIHRLVRLGGAWTTFRSKRLKIWAARGADSGPPPGVIDGLTVGTGTGGLVLEVVQPEGKPRMAAADWRNGAQPGPDESFVP